VAAAATLTAAHAEPLLILQCPLSSSAVAITSFVSPPGATAPAARSLRVAAAPHGLRCALSAWTLSL